MKIVHFLLAMLLLIYLSIMVNLISQQYFYREDMTEDKKYELTPKSVDFLKNLNSKVKIYITPATMPTDASLSHAWQKIRDLFSECKIYTDHLVIKEVNQFTQEFTKLDTEIRDIFGNLRYNMIYIFVSKEKEKQSKSISVRELYLGDPITGRIKEFIGERKIINALNTIVSNEKLKIYYTVGHSEMLIDTEYRELRFDLAKYYLEDNENALVNPIDLSRTHGVPKDCNTLLILGPQLNIKPEEMEQLEKYLSEGGRIFISLAPSVKYSQPFYNLMTKYGIEIDNRVVISSRGRGIEVRNFSVEHKINEGMHGKSITFPQTVMVKKDPKFVNDPRIQELLYCLPEDFIVDPTKEKPEQAVQPKSLAVASQVGASRLVVWGSSHAISSVYMTYGQYTGDYFGNTIRWLGEKEDKIFAPTKVFSKSPLKLSDKDMNLLYVVCFGLVPSLGILLGIVTFILRRK